MRSLTSEDGGSTIWKASSSRSRQESVDSESGAPSSPRPSRLLGIPVEKSSDSTFAHPLSPLVSRRIVWTEVVVWPLPVLARRVHSTNLIIARVPKI